MTRPFFVPSCTIILAIVLGSCATLPKGSFESSRSPFPDYADKKYWAALPSVKDSADSVPLDLWKDEQSTSAADVFFIHPTTYTGKPGQNKWNADIHDRKVNLRTDQYPIRYQASIFNGAGCVYAPRYRQAHLHSFYTKKKDDAAKALDLAYEDVRNAFRFYLDHYNAGRPFIIAAHSQGTIHAGRLLREFMDGKPLQEKLIVAYIPGIPVPADFFQNIPPCLGPEETGCICSWRTVKKGTLPAKLHYPEGNILVTNPITWTCDEHLCTKEAQMGAILRDFNTLMPQLVEAQIHEDLLWVNKPKFPGSFLFVTKNYHIADYNFFYADVRKNAQDRVRAYLDKH